MTAMNPILVLPNRRRPRAIATFSGGHPARVCPARRAGAVNARRPQRGRSVATSIDGDEHSATIDYVMA